MSNQPQAAKLFRASSPCAFSLVELLVVVAIIGILSSILLPALARAKARAQGVYCLNNTKQLALAWIVYADDQNGRLPYNLESRTGASMAVNWVNNILDWELSSDNTNAVALAESGIGPYTSRSASVYRCPSDYVLSSIQKDAGWNARVRSYSMNAMIGDAGSVSAGGTNRNNPDYIQFFKYSSIPRPSDIFVFIDEHPDTIDDGYFLNSAAEPKWRNIPASYHDGASGLAFADGHAEMHKWRRASTKPPARPGAAVGALSLRLRNYDLQDYLWVLSTMSIERRSDGYHY
jgi:prepilin-type N-terminal cleavage/methylation domain-containing protein/prepilin-type processing-associated H-X9-DG protein